MRIQGKRAHETARDFAARVLREKIISLELEPGSVISENELAEEIGVSRTPVRDALGELSRIGIIEVFPQRGSMVAKIDSIRVEEARFMRLALECAVIELACDMARPEDIILLESNLRLQDFYLHDTDPDKLHELDNAFHRKLFGICQKEVTYALMDSLNIHFNRVRRMVLNAPHELRIWEDHRNLLETVRDGDKSRARDLMVTHLTRYTFDEAQLRSRYPQYFTD